MARFAKSQSVASPKKKRNTPDTVNKAGGAAFSLAPKLEFVTLLATSFCCDRYHESGGDQMDRIVALVRDRKVSPQFAAKSAIYARDVLNMRSITHVCAAALGDAASGEGWLDAFYEKVVVRPDDMTETVAFWLANMSRTGNLPAAMKRGFARAFKKFDDYQISKYKGTGAVKLFDVINLVHPKTESVDRYKKGQLTPPETWEVKLSAAGSDDNKKAAVWAGLLSEKKLGYMALLRNLRNLIEQADSKTLDLALEQLVDPKAVANSRQLPFRFYTAYKMVQEAQNPIRSRKVLAALSDACDLSLCNLQDMLTGPTLVAVDTSASMGSAAAGSNIMSCVESGMLFGCAVYKAVAGSELMQWASSAEYININPRMPVVDMVATACRNVGRVGHGTDMSQVFEHARTDYDRVIVFSDMQVWRGDTVLARRKYERANKCNPWIHLFDLGGHGTTQLPFDRDARKNRLTMLAGFSEKVLQMLDAIEQDPQTMLDHIEAIEL